MLHKCVRHLDIRSIPEIHSYFHPGKSYPSIKSIVVLKLVCYFSWHFSVWMSWSFQNKRDHKKLLLPKIVDHMWIYTSTGGARPSVIHEPTYAMNYNDVIMFPMASQIIRLTIVSSNVYSGADQRKHQSSASLTFVLGIHRWPVNSPHKRPVTRKMVSFDDVIMDCVY